MPELPEVETIKRGLEPRILRAEISAVVVGDTKILQFVEEQIRELSGQEVRRLTRRGKYLVFMLSRHYLVIHLGMSGQLTLRNPRQPDSPKFLRHLVTGLQKARQHAPDRHTHFQVYFRDGRALLFRDPRKFGKVFLLPLCSDSFDDLFSGLGMEPFGEEYSLDAFNFYLGKRKARIKSVLLDQKFVAGIGNIYADEALFEAGVHPMKRVRYLTRKEKRRIFEAIPRVLEKGIHYGGTTLRDFVDSDGNKGSHQEFLNVYGRQGENCRRCGNLIRKTAVGGRGTHYCPGCQKR